MAPIIDKNNRNNLFEPIRPFKPESLIPVALPKPEACPADRLSGFKNQGDQQRERLEKLLAAGTAGMSNGIFAYRGTAFQKASEAYHRVINDGLENFDKSPDLAKITSRAIAEYERVLKNYGVNPLEAPNYSVVNQLNLLKNDAVRGGDFYTVDRDVMKNLVSSESPKVFARMLWTGERDAAAPNFRSAIDNKDARLAFFDPKSRQGKTIAWSTTPEDLTGARLDYREVMRRIGWTEKQIAEADPKQFKLVVFTEESAVNVRVPTESEIIKTAAGDQVNFRQYLSEPPEFWDKVIAFDYEKLIEKFNSSAISNFDDFVESRLSREDARIAAARRQMEYSMGVNPLFSGDGLTKRPDAINGRVGGREFITDNLPDEAALFEMAKRGQVAFLDLQDQGITDKTPVNITDAPPAVSSVSNRQMLVSETRGGALLGGTFSAAASLYQIFGEGEKANAQTLAANTLLGTGVGAGSAAGERVIGNRIAGSLGNSSFARNGFDRLYDNGAARGFVSRMVGTEASNITSSTFNSTARTIAGRIGGAGIVGGIVSGGFAAYDQIGAYRRGEVTASQAVGTVTGEAAVGVGAGLAGAAAGAAIGSIIPGAGTVVGGVIGFGVGMAAGYFADKGLRGLGVNTMIAQGVTNLIDGGSQVVNSVGDAVSSATNAVGDFADDVGGAISGGLSSIFD